jgi:hypothetical protein
MKMDSNLFENIRNGKYEKLTHWKISIEYKLSCLDIFGDHFVNLTLLCIIVVKFKIILDQKGDVLKKNVIKEFF